eukprot:TRINITY_DN5966_c0_g1_i1.p1 TRINITY_DN5966_c0_g1~~TRINITY_DN5966_c0_g1_i1.p1  ORF type:complete len:279 (+),score=88.52 TRINITY_DN5966_c0_g1_i1:47-883(+)
MSEESFRLNTASTLFHQRAAALFADAPTYEPPSPHAKPMESTHEKTNTSRVRFVSDVIERDQQRQDLERSQRETMPFAQDNAAVYSKSLPLNDASKYTKYDISEVDDSDAANMQAFMDFSRNYKDSNRASDSSADATLFRRPKPRSEARIDRSALVDKYAKEAADPTRLSFFHSEMSHDLAEQNATVDQEMKIPTTEKKSFVKGRNYRTRRSHDLQDGFDQDDENVENQTSVAHASSLSRISKGMDMNKEDDEPREMEEMNHDEVGENNMSDEEDERF